MTYATPTSTDLATYLGQDSVDTNRGTQMIGWAEQLCLSIVSPLPDGAQIIVLGVASRGFVNPQGSVPETAGPYGTSFGRPAAGGIWLTRSDARTLRRMNGSGGAFTIDTIPVGYSPELPWWDFNEPLLPGDLGWAQSP